MDIVKINKTKQVKEQKKLLEKDKTKTKYESEQREKQE